MTTISYLVAALASFTLTTGATLTPVISSNFPDPALYQNGSTWYAYATSGNGKRIQVAKAEGNFKGPWTVLDTDALPSLPSWAASGGIWAPDVVQRADGKYVLYFAAKNRDKGSHCVGAAVGDNLTGHFTPVSGDPIACQTSGGGAIDPAGFRDTNGDVYVVYKVDGNTLGSGTACGGSGPTPLMLQKMQADRVTPVGSPHKILDHDANDGPLVEAPSLNFKDGKYYLFFSSNCYNTDYYDTSYAIATSVTGPYAKVHALHAPLLRTGDFGGLTAPGGARINGPGNKMVFHATLQKKPLVRAMYAAEITENDGVVTVN